MLRRRALDRAAPLKQSMSVPSLGLTAQAIHIAYAFEFTGELLRALTRNVRGRYQRVMRLIFEPSRLKLYISPCGSITKPMMGVGRGLVSMDSPAPSVTTTIDPSTPTFQPEVFSNPASASWVMN